MKEKIDWATEHQLEQMFLRFYPEESLARAAVFAQNALSHGKNVSLAQVQGLFLVYKNDPQAVIDGTGQLWTL